MVNQCVRVDGPWEAASSIKEAVDNFLCAADRTPEEAPKPPRPEGAIVGRQNGDPETTSKS